MGAYVGYQGYVIEYYDDVRVLQLKQQSEPFLPYAVACDGSSQPHCRVPCFGAACVHKDRYSLLWCSLSSVPPVLLHRGEFTSAMVELFATAFGIALLRRSRADRSPMCVVYTDKKEQLGTLCAAFASRRTDASRRKAHKAKLKQTSSSFWIWCLILLAEAEQLLRSTCAVLRVQAIQTAGVQVEKHRWHMPERWLDPDSLLRVPSGLVDLEGSVLASSVQTVLQLLSSLDWLAGKERICGSLIELVRHNAVRVVAGALSSDQDVVSIDFRYRSGSTSDASQTSAFKAV